MCRGKFNLNDVVTRQVQLERCCDGCVLCCVVFCDTACHAGGPLVLGFAKNGASVNGSVTVSLWGAMDGYSALTPGARVCVCVCVCVCMCAVFL